MIKFPSASGVERAILCPYSCRLPKVSEPSGEAALRGTAIHAFIAAHLDENAPRYTAKDLLRAVPGFPIDELFENIQKYFRHVSFTGQTEITFAYNPVNAVARVLGQHLDRDYSNLVYPEFAGTADIVDEANQTILDWKTGREGNTTVVEENWQMKTLALMAFRAFGWSQARATLLFVRTDGGVDARSAVFSASDLGRFAERITRAWERANHPDDLPTPGDKQCKYCPSQKFCPAMNQLAERTLAADPVVVEKRFLELLAENPAKAYEAHKLLESVTRNLGRELYKTALTTPIPLEGGKVYGPRETVSTTLDNDKVYSLLAETYNVDVARAAFSMSTSKTGIERAVATSTRKGGKAEAMRWVMARLEEEGAISKTTKTKVDEHYPNQGKDENA